MKILDDQSYHMHPSVFKFIANFSVKDPYLSVESTVNKIAVAGSWFIK